MSGLVRQMVLDRKFGDSTLKRVLDRLAWAAADDGTAVFISVATIADDCEIATRTVQRLQGKLQDLGLLILDKEAVGHRWRTYRLDIGKLARYPLTNAGEVRRARREGIDAGSRQAAAQGGDSRGDIHDISEENAPAPGVTSTTPGVTSTTSRGDIDDTPIEDTLRDTQKHTGAGAREGRPCGAADPRTPCPAGEAREAGEAASGSAGKAPRPGGTGSVSRETAHQPSPDRALDKFSKPQPACGRWQERIGVIEDAIGAEVFKAWVEPLVVLSDDAGALVLGAPTPFMAKWAFDNYGADIRAVMECETLEIKLHNFAIEHTARRLRERQERDATARAAGGYEGGKATAPGAGGAARRNTKRRARYG